MKQIITLLLYSVVTFGKRQGNLINLRYENKMPFFSEICVQDRFKEKCHNGILIVTKAWYGRMNSRSTCLTDQKVFPDNLCKKDVTKPFQTDCNGRKSCEIPIHKLVQYEQCSGYLGYLEVFYYCQEG